MFTFIINYDISYFLCTPKKECVVHSNSKIYTWRYDLWVYFGGQLLNVMKLIKVYFYFIFKFIVN